MITASNYFIEVERIGVNTLPETLKKGHDLVVKSTSNGANWATYQSSEGIKKVIDLYFQKLSDYASTLKPDTPQAKSSPEPKKKPATEKSKERKASPKKVKEKKEPKNVKHVEHIREEVKYIKRYVGLHNKVKSPNTILSFIKALQRSIVQKLIRKTSPLSEEIEMIQNKLVQAYNKMKGEESFAINDKDLNRLVAIAGGEKVLSLHYGHQAVYWIAGARR
ncbi:MAG: hypothetical protein U5K54_15215 [Cytophagales bacterium]|nr:hypothetical protein [Cytophagales bacterium]